MMLSQTLLIFSCVGFADIGSAAELAVDVSPEIIVQAESEWITYRYVVSNRSSSTQMLDEFTVAVDDTFDGRGGSLKNLGKPSTKPWTNGIVLFDLSLSRSTVGWGAAGTDTTNLNRPPAGAVPPGESIAGFSYQSRGLPTVQPFYVCGFVAPPSEEEVLEHARLLTGTLYESLDELPGALMRQMFPPASADAFRGLTLGAELLPPGQQDPGVLLDRLKRLKDEAAQRGWIKDPGTVTSLNKKLAAARKALDRWFGGKRAAREILRAFKHELEAQRGKHVDENAYFLLRANADYLIEARLR